MEYYLVTRKVVEKDVVIAKVRLVAKGKSLEIIKKKHNLTSRMNEYEFEKVNKEIYKTHSLLFDELKVKNYLTNK